MRLYLLRHAIAAPRDPRRWPADGERPLTRDGVRKMEVAALGLRNVAPDIDVVLTSPLVRARQTAKIVVAALRPRPPLRTLRPLAPGGGAGGVLAGLTTLPHDASVMVVGHEPDLSALAAALIQEARGHLGIEFKKGGLCRIDCSGAPRPGNGRLIFHLPPRILRRLSGPDR